MAKSQTVSKADLVDRVADETGMKKKDVKTVMDSVLEHVSTRFNKEQKGQLIEHTDENGIRVGVSYSALQNRSERHYRTILPPESHGRYDLNELRKIARKIKTSD